MSLTTTVYYPFHPHFNLTLKVLTWPRKATGLITVLDPHDKSLKIPVWMCQPDAQHFQISHYAELSYATLQDLNELLQVQTVTKMGPVQPLEKTHATRRTRSQRTTRRSRDARK